MVVMVAAALGNYTTTIEYQLSVVDVDANITADDHVNRYLSVR